MIAVGENFETQVWLDIALHANYLTQEKYADLLALSEEVGRLLSYMQVNQPQFAQWKT
jgi:four helix bundle protein